MAKNDILEMLVKLKEEAFEQKYKSYNIKDKEYYMGKAIAYKEIIDILAVLL